MWSALSAACNGSVAGTCQNFPDKDGNGRTDLQSVLGTANEKADKSLSNDCGLKDGFGDLVDLNGVVDLKLPTPPEDCCKCAMSVRPRDIVLYTFYSIAETLYTSKTVNGE